MKLPYEYEVRFYEDIVDTSSSGLGFQAKPVNFTLWNKTLDQPADFLYIEKYQIVEEDTLLHDFWVLPKITFEPEPNRNIFGLGHQFMINPGSIDTTVSGFDEIITIGDVPIIPPGAGDVQGYYTSLPFSENDVYRFSVAEGRLDSELEKEELGRIAVVPNPYVVAAEWEPRVNFTSGRGPRKIDFIHLPKQCTIRVYTISGYLVDTIYHDEPMEDGAESWNLVSKDGMDIAYGVYIYHVDAPGVGEHIGKFAVIK
jgi:hypothetical protein